MVTNILFAGSYNFRLPTVRRLFTLQISDMHKYNKVVRVDNPLENDGAFRAGAACDNNKQRLYLSAIMGNKNSEAKQMILTK